MKGGSKGLGAGAAAVLMTVLLVAAADAAVVARRLGTGDVPVSKDDALLSGPKPNPCTHDPNNSGQACHGPPAPGHQEVTVQKQERSSPVVSVSKAKSGPNSCTSGPKNRGKNCHHPPPRTAP
jgi:hypothetical protein